jgi:hypothetical protein
MKTKVMMLAVLLLVGLLGSSCATISRLNTEYEEEMTRVETLSPEEKAVYEEGTKINWNEFDSD